MAFPQEDCKQEEGDQNDHCHCVLRTVVKEGEILILKTRIDRSYVIKSNYNTYEIVEYNKECSPCARRVTCAIVALNTDLKQPHAQQQAHSQALNAIQLAIPPMMS